MNDTLVMVRDMRPNRSDAVKNRALLLETARRLFTEQGIDAVSMSAVAEAAGVGKGTLYRHFTSKTELCLALLDQDQRDLQEQTLQRLRDVSDPVENLRWFLGAAAAFVERNRGWLAPLGHGGGAATLTHPAHLWWRQTIRSLLQQAGFNADIDYAADVLYVLLNPDTIQFQRDALGYDMERVERGLQATLDQILG